jgi:hypothetical protein
MGIFSREAAEIVPHAADDPRNLGLGKAGKGTTDVAPSMSGDVQKGANPARQRTAERGRAIERQKLEHAEDERRSPGLQTIGQRGCPSGQAGRGRPSRDQLRNSGGNSFSAPQAEQVAVSSATRCSGPIPTQLRSRNCRKDSRCLRFRAAAVQQFEAFASHWCPRGYA